MALKITLKPNERVIIGGAVVTNGKHKSELFVENKVLILRQKDILSANEANSPCKRLYLAIQLMYVDEENMGEYHKIYWDLVQDLLKAAPSLAFAVDQISEQILSSRYYQALKLAGKLINYEQEVLKYVNESNNSRGRTDSPVGP